MKAANPISLIEAAYTSSAEEKAWLEALTDAGSAYDLGYGVIAWTVDLSGAPRVETITARGDAGRLVAPLRSFVEKLSQRAARALFAPTEFVGNAAWRMNRLARPRASAGAEILDPSFRPPLWVMIGGDARRSAVALAFHAPPKFAADLAFPHEHRRVLGLVAAHFGSALRLRAALPEATEDATVAVLDPKGRVLHATGDGKEAAARTSLSEAVVRAERARGRLRRTDSTSAVKLWRALVDGRWSIVESVERDGKRLLLARANPPTSPDLRALTKEEGNVVWLAAFGHTHKYIAYELGVTVSSVVRRLKSAMLKLGVATRHDLLRKLGR